MEWNQSEPTLLGGPTIHFLVTVEFVSEKKHVLFIADLCMRRLYIITMFGKGTYIIKVYIQIKKIFARFKA